MSFFLPHILPNYHSSKKAQPPAGNCSTHEYELLNHLNTFYNSFASVRVFRTGAFCFLQFFSKSVRFVWQFLNFLGSGVRKGKSNITRPFAAAKGGENMNEPNRTEWENRCAFNAYCKKALKFEASNAQRDVRHHQLREVTFSSLSLQEEEQLFTNDRYFAGEEADDKSFFVAGMEITPKLLADAIHALPEEKRNAVLLYYFFDMSDPEIAKLLNLSRSTVQYRSDQALLSC